jgi:hypothetical protein
VDSFLSGISPAGGAAGVLLAILVASVGLVFRRVERGSSDVMSGYSGLAKELRQSAADADAARDKAVAELAAERAAHARERDKRARIEEYAWQLEAQHGIQHRTWSDVNDA